MKQHFTLIACIILTNGLWVGCQKAVPVKTVKTALTQVEQTVSTTTAGTVEAKNQAILVFGSLGRVQEIYVEAGASVTRGQLLAKQENKDIESVFQNARNDRERSLRLFREKLISRANLDEAIRTYEVAKANLDKTEIRAPFNGVITELNLNVGETSQPQSTPDKPPMRIVDQQPRRIEGNIDEVDLPKIKLNAPARIKILAVRPKPYSAVVTRIVPFISTNKEQERTAKVELEITESKALIPVGASAEVEIIVESKDNALAIPSRAILGAGSSRHVFRVLSGRLKKTPITVGIGNYDRTEILSGLAQGDSVALPGETELSDEMKINAESLEWP